IAGAAEALVTRVAGRARLAAPHRRAARRAARCFERAGQILRRRYLPPLALAPGPALFPCPAVGARGTLWRYHDERWDRIVNRWEYRALVRHGQQPLADDEPQSPGPRLLVTDRELTVNVPAGGAER